MRFTVNLSKPLDFPPLFNVSKMRELDLSDLCGPFLPQILELIFLLGDKVKSIW